MYRERISISALKHALLGKKSASCAGVYGDHLVAINSAETCQNVVFPEFELAAKNAGKDLSKMDKMVEVQLYLSDQKTGVREIKESGEAAFLSKDSFGESDPRMIEKLSWTVKDEKIASNCCFVSSAGILFALVKNINKLVQHI